VRRQQAEARALGQIVGIGVAAYADGERVKPGSEKAAA